MPQITYVTNGSEKALAAQENLKEALNTFEVKENIVFAIGGDGTMLQAVKDHRSQGAIFIGISAGSLGLLQTIEVSQIPDLVRVLKDHSYKVIEAPLLSVGISDSKGEDARTDNVSEIIGYGFNDVSIERQYSRAAKFKLLIDDSSGDFIGDGVIFSTPMGSTAYSLAAGGPIIDSSIQNVFVVTPNNPHLSSLHSSLQRPHVLSANQSVRIQPSVSDDYRSIQIAIDGEVISKEVKQPLVVRLSEEKVRMLQLNIKDISRQIEEKRLGRL